MYMHVYIPSSCAASEGGLPATTERQAKQRYSRGVEIAALCYDGGATSYSATSCKTFLFAFFTMYNMAAEKLFYDASRRVMGNPALCGWADSACAAEASA